MIWYTADTHFGHANIIKYCKRPFVDTKQMDRQLIERWNDRVAKTDTVHHLGDFAAGGNWRYALDIFNSLNGTKHLIRGNHDHSGRMRRLPWASVHALQTVYDCERPIVLCHYGLRVWDRSHHGALHFYGHSHGGLRGDDQSCDVGVDCWDYKPVNLQEILTSLAHQPKRGHPDHHQPRTQDDG